MTSPSFSRRPSLDNSTIKPPPPLDDRVSPIENAIAIVPLEELGPNIFTNAHPSWQPPQARGIYGGGVIAQALLAAQYTVPPEFIPHSMHCYFILAGNLHAPLLFHVDILRSGRSFHTRTVQVRQQGRTIFTTTCSFTLPIPVVLERSGNDVEDKKIVRHQTEMPTEILDPEECENDEQLIERLLKEGRIDDEQATAAATRSKRNPFEWRAIGNATSLQRDLPSPKDPTVSPARRVVRQWVRSKSPVVNPLMREAALAYCSDTWFIGTIGRVNPAARREKVGMLVSLDHTIHFHSGERTNVDEWMLVETQSPWAGEERGLARMKVWSRDGRLVATCLQEGIVRLKDGREGQDQPQGDAVIKPTEVPQPNPSPPSPKKVVPNSKL